MVQLGEQVAGFTHDLNTPVAVAMHSSTTICETRDRIEQILEGDEFSEEELANLLDRISEAAMLSETNLSRAAEMTSSFKRIAIEQTREIQTEFDLTLMIRDTIFSLHNQFKRTQIHIELDAPETIIVRGIPGQFIQLLTNLLMNAYFHAFDNGNKPGHIRIKVMKEDGMLDLSVSDDGAGVLAGDLPHIFEHFFTTARNEGGSGQGLHICRHIVEERMGGGISCHSTEGHGACFTIQVPV